MKLELSSLGGAFTRIFPSPLFECRSNTLTQDAIMRYKCILIFLNPLNAELNPILHLLALVAARHIVHVSRIRVKVVCVLTKLRAGRRVGSDRIN